MIFKTKIQLKDTAGKVRAWIRFNDPGQFFENDYESSGIIRMYLPSTMFENVIDVLRNEKPVYIYFTAGRAFLGTSAEPTNRRRRSVANNSFQQTARAVPLLEGVV